MIAKRRGWSDCNGRYSWWGSCSASQEPRRRVGRPGSFIAGSRQVRLPNGTSGRGAEYDWDRGRCGRAAGYGDRDARACRTQLENASSARARERSCGSPPWAVAVLVGTCSTADPLNHGSRLGCKASNGPAWTRSRNQPSTRSSGAVCREWCRVAWLSHSPHSARVLGEARFEAFGH